MDFYADYYVKAILLRISIVVFFSPFFSNCNIKVDALYG